MQAEHVNTLCPCVTNVWLGGQLCGFYAGNQWHLPRKDPYALPRSWEIPPIARLEVRCKIRWHCQEPCDIEVGITVVHIQQGEWRANKFDWHEVSVWVRLLGLYRGLAGARSKIFLLFSLSHSLSRFSVRISPCFFSCVLFNSALFFRINWIHPIVVVFQTMRRKVYWIPFVIWSGSRR